MNCRAELNDREPMEPLESSTNTTSKAVEHAAVTAVAPLHPLGEAVRVGLLVPVVDDDGVLLLVGVMVGALLAASWKDAASAPVFSHTT